ncbi:C2H2-type zinc finger protein [Methanosarcina mazei]|uniref:C2H2-type zinc finger protein n=1 Tax=Methanosarcina mazei TaxID=2209 RepID=UPI0009BC4E93
MTKCKRCKSSDLSSNGYCHVCKSYDQSAPSNLDFEQLCNTCNQYFTDYDKYLEHLQSHPVCDVCKERFVSETELHKHLKTHECSICNLYFNSVTRHNKQQHSQCDLCQKWFLDKTALNEHLTEHPQCEYCKDRFKSDTDLQLHKETEHKCPACNLYHYPILEHLKQHSYCNLCKKWLLDEKALNEHLTEHPQCEYCKNRFSTQVALISHIDSVHKCNVCYGYFINVRLHMKCEHIYCRVCRKYFIDNYQYEKSHIKCQYCGEMFENSSLLENHISISHYCIVCKIYFHSSKERESHMRSTHPELARLSDCIDYMYGFGVSRKKVGKSIKCPYCDKLFSAEFGCKQHIKDKHSIA